MFAKFDLPLQARYFWKIWLLILQESHLKIDQDLLAIIHFEEIRLTNHQFQFQSFLLMIHQSLFQTNQWIKSKFEAFWRTKMEKKNFNLEDRKNSSLTMSLMRITSKMRISTLTLLNISFIQKWTRLLHSLVHRKIWNKDFWKVQLFKRHLKT